MLLQESDMPLLPDPARVEDEVMNWLVRMGPLEPLICNPAYEEIFVDGPHEVGVVERTGRIVMLPDVYFDSDEEVREIAKRALASVNRRHPVVAQYLAAQPSAPFFRTAVALYPGCFVQQCIC